MNKFSPLFQLVKKSAQPAAIAAIALMAQACSCPFGNGKATIPASDSRIRYSGRSTGIGTNDVAVGYSGARERLRFEGTSVAARIRDDSGENYAVAFVDGKMGDKFRLNAPDGVYKLADNLAYGAHTVEIVRVTECNFGLTHFLGFELNAGAKILAWPVEKERRIEFIGDSITCGYGVEAANENEHFSAATENFCLGIAGLAARKLDAEYLVVSRSGIGIMRNYDGPREGGTGGDTMPDIYPNTFYMIRGAWDFSGFAPDVVCINLGTNDFSTSGCDIDKFVATYIAFAGKILERHPNAKLVILQGPMENSRPLRDALGRVIEALSKQAPGRVSYFAMSAQGAHGYGADWHPSRLQAEIGANELSGFLSSLMGW